MTSSRVPWIRPGRPRAGFSRRRSTACEMRCTRARAATGFSRAMYSASSSRFLSAVVSHLTCIDAPLAQHLRDAIVACKVVAVGFGKCVSNLLDLPLVQIDEITYGLGSKKGFRSLRRFGEMIESLFQLGLQADCHRRGHGQTLLCASVYILSRDRPRASTDSTCRKLRTDCLDTVAAPGARTAPRPELRGARASRPQSAAGAILRARRPEA